jgi:hypothetical protein
MKIMTVYYLKAIIPAPIEVVVVAVVAGAGAVVGVPLHQSILDSVPVNANFDYRVA